MRTYTEKEVKNLTVKSFTAVCNGVDTYSRAFLKENAVKYFQKQDAGIIPEHVSIAKMTVNGSSLDEIVEHGIVYKIIDMRI